MKKDENMDYLFKAILSLRTEDECYAFFEDLCTPQELKAISQRLHVAKLLTDNCVYNDIVKKTGASTNFQSKQDSELPGGGRLSDRFRPHEGKQVMAGYGVFAQVYDKLTLNVPYDQIAEYYDAKIRKFRDGDGNFLADAG